MKFLNKIVIAHRGFSALHPENTLLAITEAFDSAAANGVEIDLHLTADREVILQHDQDLERMTQGGTGSVFDRPWYGYIENLRSQPDGAEPVCRLSSVLQYLKETTITGITRYLVLDVKDDQPLEILVHIKTLLETFFSQSSHADLIIYLGVWNEEFALEAQSVFSGLFGDSFKLTFIAESCTQEQLISPLFHAFNLNVNKITDAVLEIAAQVNKDVLLWTCNSPLQIEKALKSSCKAILTDDPRSVK